ncbi:hypothetical protein OC845_006181 [Tilletia horrida]|nr:hypothetical protein OC845_006181 [Tilletia horrida]
MRPLIFTALLALASTALATPVEVGQAAGIAARAASPKPTKPTGHIVLKDAKKKVVGYFAKDLKFVDGYGLCYNVTTSLSKAMTISQPDAGDDVSIFNPNPQVKPYVYLTVEPIGGGQLGINPGGFGGLTGNQFNNEYAKEFSYNSTSKEIKIIYYDPYYGDDYTLNIGLSGKVIVVYSDYNEARIDIPDLKGPMRAYFRPI